MTAGSAQTIGSIGAAAPSQSFVINLAASTSPVALAHPSSPELKRFTFFVSRQREDGRERFRLHMGYFTTQEQAEALLASVRDIYPAAWAGPAPTVGVGRRDRIASGNVVAAPAPATAPEVEAVVAPQLEPSLESMSNVRDVIAQLSEVATLTQISPVPVAPLLAPAPAPAPGLNNVDPELSGAAALQLLEMGPVTPGLESEPEVRLVTPEDTQTLTDIKLDKQNNAPPCFAVQLVWSVSPIEAGALPHLAIFDAYTLYNVEGNRQGRKWFGLRLGFFSDPNSAAQVANYVRSEYKAVAVVPVAVKERDRARGDGALPAAAADGPQKTTDTEFKREEMAGFELLTDDRPVAAKRDLDDGARGNTPAPVPRIAPKAKPVAVRPRTTGKRVVVRKPAPSVQPDRTVSAGVGGAEVLESTLEILGASTLSLDEGGREIITDAAARKPATKPSEGTSRFSKLLSRLGGG